MVGHIPSGEDAVYAGVRGAVDGFEVARLVHVHLPLQQVSVGDV